MDELLTLQQLAQHLGVSVDSLHKMRQKRQIPDPIVLGSRRLRWRKSDIEAWLQSLQPRAL